MKKLLFTLTLLLMAFMAHAQTLINGIYYNLDSSAKTAEVTSNGYNSYSGYVSIPSKVTYSGYSYNVTSIGQQAFLACINLTSIDIPNSVKSIVMGAFYGCTNLSVINVDTTNPKFDSRDNSNAIIETESNTLVVGCKNTIIPNSVTTIGDMAFENCTDLISIDIPNSVTKIGSRAFRGCTSMTSITIPVSVTIIGWSAFDGCSGLTSITIPVSVTSIGSSVFDNCTSLTSIVIPDNVTSIGSNAFRGCTSLSFITIGNGVTSIGSGAFEDCKSLTSIVIPGNVTSISSSAFSGCTKMESMKVDVANTIYDSRDNCNAIIETSSNKLVVGCKNTIVPNSIATIGQYAFNSCIGLTSIDIPGNVTSIGNSAFYSCIGLTSITIGNSVVSIGSSAFHGCTGLTSVSIGKGVTSIGEKAFDGCNNLANIEFHCKDIGVWFQKLNSIKKIIIGEGVNSIVDYAFYRCIGLTTVNISNSVTSIGNNPFRDCNELTSITIEATNNYYDSRDNCNAIIETSSNKLITGCKNTFIPNTVASIGMYAFSDFKDLTSIVIPNSVTSIGYHAFNGCSGLTSINIPNSVISINGYAFRGCSNLTSAILGNSVTSIGDWAFYDCSRLTSVTVNNPVPVSIGLYDFSNSKNATLYVPRGSKSAYQTANNWKNFKEIIEFNNGLGDVNGDGEISISDVTLLVDYLLEQADDCFILSNADVNKDGRISVSDAVSIIKLILEGDPESQGSLTCPDGNHPHMIDLGLPSGTKWACCNVGADKPEAYGGYYAWGETEEKDYYDWSTYTLCNGNATSCVRIYSIGGTQYDAAYVNWGSPWYLPSADQFEELIRECSKEFTTYNNVNGLVFIGPSGNKLFLPLAGVYMKDWRPTGGFSGKYWSSSHDITYFNYLSKNLDISYRDNGQNQHVRVSYDSREYGNSIRAVAN